MMKRTVGLALVTIFLTGSPAFAEPDKFGQEVPKALERQVLQARLMRLPYQKDKYDPENSERILLRVIERKPDYYRAHFNLGLTYHELGDYEKAVEAFDAAMRIRDEQQIDDFTLINTAGWSSLKNSDFPRAERLLLQAEKLTEGSDTYTEGAVHSNLGELYFLTQRFDEAEHHLKIASDEFGSREAAYYLELIDRTQKVIIQQKIQIDRRMKLKSTGTN